MYVDNKYKFIPHDLFYRWREYKLTHPVDDQLRVTGKTAQIQKLTAKQAHKPETMKYHPSCAELPPCDNTALCHHTVWGMINKPLWHILADTDTQQG